MAYTADRHRYFFGRGDDIELISSNVRAYRFCLMFGPSGVGKSSVLQAGVVRSIRDQTANRRAHFEDEPVETVVAYLKDWRDDPVAALWGSILGGFRHEGLAVPPDVPKPADMGAAIKTVCETHDVDLVLILDQFEEFFLYHGRQVGDFARLLARLTAPGGCGNVLISMREDAVSRLDEFEGILLGVFAHTLKLEHLDEPSARAAVVGPLSTFNAEVPADESREVEPALVDRLLQQVRAGRVQVDSTQESSRATTAATTPAAGGEVRIEAPFLQLVLTRLWDEEQKRGSRLLRLSTLEELGDAQAIVSQHLDRVMTAFTEAEQSVLADAFGHLVTPSGSKIAHRPSDLAAFSGQDTALVSALVRRLAEGDQRILREVPQPLDEPHAEPRYEIFHDVLALAVTDWRRRYLVEVDATRQKAQLLAERERVEAENQQARRRLRRARLVVAGMSMLVFVSAVLTWVAWHSVEQANNANDKAMRNATLDRVNQLLDEDPAEALRLGLKEWRATSDPDDDDRAYEDSFRRAIDAAETAVELRLGSPTVTAFFLGETDLVTVTEDGYVRVWRGDGDAALDDVPEVDVDVTEGGDERVLQVVAAGDNGFVVLRSDSGGLYSVALDDGEVSQPPLSFESFGDGGSIFAPPRGAGDLVVVWDSSGHQILWDVGRNMLVESAGLTDHLLSAAVDASGEHLAVVTQSTYRRDEQAEVWNLRSGELMASSSVEELDDERDVSSAEVDFTEQGQVILTAGDYSSGVYHWDWRSGEAPVSIDRYFSRVFGVEVAYGSENAQLVIAANKSGWSYRQKRNGTWEWVKQYVPLGTSATQVAVSTSDARTLVLGSEGGEVALYQDGPTRLPVAMLRGHDGAITHAEFSADGRRLVTASRDGTARVWRVPDPSRLHESTTSISHLETSVDGEYRFLLDDFGYLTRLDSSGTAETEFEVAGEDRTYVVDGKPVDLAVAPDGSAVVAADDVCSSAPKLGAYEARSLELQTPEGRGVVGCVTAVAWSADERTPLIVAGNDDNQLIAWDAVTGAVVHVEELGASSSEVRSVAISRDGSTVVATAGSGASGRIHVFDLETWESRNTWGASSVDRVDISADGRHVATAGLDSHHIQLWDVEAENSLGTLDQAAASGSLGQVVFSPDETSSRIAVGTSEGLVYVWDRSSRRLVSVVKAQADFVQSLAFDPQDIEVLLVAGDDGDLVSFQCRLCSTESGELDSAARARLAQVITVGD